MLFIGLIRRRQTARYLRSWNRGSIDVEMVFFFSRVEERSCVVCHYSRGRKTGSGDMRAIPDSGKPTFSLSGRYLEHVCLVPIHRTDPDPFLPKDMER